MRPPVRPLAQPPRGGDPVKNGLVASRNRPDGNVTGVTFLTNELGPKRLGLLRDLLPNAGLTAALVNPTNPNAVSDTKALLAAAESMGMTLSVLRASNEREIDAFFATLTQRRATAFLTTPDALFISRRQQFAVLAAYHKIPRNVGGGSGPSTASIAMPRLKS